MLTIMMLLIIVACGGSDDNDEIVQIQEPEVSLNASHLTENGYFDGLLYYKITSNSTNEVAIAKVEKSAETVVIPSHVSIEGKTYKCTRIDNNAFSYLDNLTSITIPNTLTSIGSDAFKMSKHIQNVYISNLEAWLQITYKNWTSTPFFNGGQLYLNGKEIIDLVIPNGITTINEYAFMNCKSIKSITIHNSLKSIDSSAFYGCDNLSSVYITDLESWLSIISSNNPFYNYHLYFNGEEVKNLVIPNSVKTIVNGAFNGCTSITSLSIANSVTSIGSAAFSGCSALASVTIPNSVTSIGANAFHNCI